MFRRTKTLSNHSLLAMDTANVKPPEKKKTTSPTAPPTPSLPEELVVDCLARTSKSYYRCFSLVSKSFHSILSSPEIYKLRFQIGNTEPCLYICLQSPTCHRWFTLEQTLITRDGEIKDKLSLAPIIPAPSSDSPAPSNSNTVAIGSEIYQLGNRTSAVRVFDCRSHTWRRAPNMAMARKNFKSVVFLDGKIYVLGGCSRKDRESMIWGEVFDLKTQIWKPIPIPIDRFDWDHKGLVLGGRLYLISNYKNYAYDTKEERWKETKELEYPLRRLCLGSTAWCIIENVMVNDYHGRYRWCYGSRDGDVMGLSDLYAKRGRDYCTVQLVNHGGKLVVIWYEWFLSYQYKRICCAVIRLEKRLGQFRLEIWGEIERFNVVGIVPKSYKLLSCLSVLL